jgi:GPH family glycoside/pentoside/hexuronide:cation symporter
LLLLVIFAMQTLGSTVFLALLPYVVKLVWLGDEAHVGVLMFVLLLSSTFALPLWENVARRFSSEYAFVGAAALSVAAYLALLALPWSDGVVGRAPAFIVMGVAFAGVQLLPFAMAAERIHRSVQVTGIPCEAIFTGVWTSVEKLALSMGAPLAASVLSISGYSRDGLTPESAAGELLLGAIAVPVVGQCLSMILLLKTARNSETLRSVI